MKALDKIIDILKGVRVRNVPVVVGYSDKPYTVISSDELIKRHSKLINTMRIESGYNREDFNKLFMPVIHRVSEYTQMVPASRRLNHKEPGGLFSFILQIAFTSFRRADGKIFAGQSRIEIRGDLEQAWRYACFLSGLFIELGRVISLIKVINKQTEEIWNPYLESIYQWMINNNVAEYSIRWEKTIDERIINIPNVWLASKIIEPESLSYLHSKSPQILDTFVNVIGGEKENPLYVIIKESVVSIIDLYIYESGERSLETAQGVSLQKMLAGAIRILAKEKWIVNKPGGRIWITDQGVYINWPPAVTDIRTHLRAEGYTGIPRDEITLAESLIEDDVLKCWPKGKKSIYFKLEITSPGVPKIPIDALRIINPNYCDIDMDIHEVVSAMVNGLSISEEKETQQKLTLDNVEVKNIETNNSTLHEKIIDSGLIDTESPGVKEELLKHEVKVSVSKDEDNTNILDLLSRYGKTGDILKSLVSEYIMKGEESGISLSDQGVIVKYPEAINTYTEDTKGFVAECCRHQICQNKNGKVKWINAPEGQSFVLIPRMKKFFNLPESYK